MGYKIYFFSTNDAVLIPPSYRTCVHFNYQNVRFWKTPIVVLRIQISFSPNKIQMPSRRGPAIRFMRVYATFSSSFYRFKGVYTAVYGRSCGDHRGKLWCLYFFVWVPTAPIEFVLRLHHDQKATGSLFWEPNRRTGNEVGCRRVSRRLWTNCISTATLIGLYYVLLKLFAFLSTIELLRIYCVLGHSYNVLTRNPLDRRPRRLFWACSKKSRYGHHNWHSWRSDGVSAF